MSDPVRFLTGLGQALATMALYGDGHPARERALDSAYEHLLELSRTDPGPTFSFLDEQVLYRSNVLRELHGWEWGSKLSSAGVQRLEFDEEVPRADFAAFLAEVLAKLQQQPAAVDTAEARQLRRPSIRFGAVSIRGATTEQASAAVATATIAYSLTDEIDAIEWVHEAVQNSGTLPIAEAEAIVRSLSIAVHSQSHIILPLLKLKSFDQYTTTHATNVSVLAMALAENLGMSAKDVRLIGTAGLLHDLGKVRIPKDILLKPGQFTEQEAAVMRQHPVEGARIILEREKRLDLAAVVAYEHHIMLNGGGYPNFRYPRDCHYASKLVHVCDVYDALCTTRPYREAWDSWVAIAYLEEKAGEEFDAELVTAFVTMMRTTANQRVVMPDRTAPEPAA